MWIKSAMPILRDKNNNAKVHCPRKSLNLSVLIRVLYVSTDIFEEGGGIAECECNWAFVLIVSKHEPATPSYKYDMSFTSLG